MTGGPADKAGRIAPRRQRENLGPVHVTQLIIVEAVTVGILAVLTHGTLTVVLAVVVGLALLVLTLGRRRGRWLAQARLLAWQFRRRRRAMATLTGDDPRLAGLRVLAPGFAVEDVALADGSRVGVARDEAGWFAAVAVSEGASASLDAVVAALAEAEQPGAILQLVTHTVPAPSVETHPSLAVASYHELLTSLGHEPVPAERETWLAVRLDARTFAADLLDHRADPGSAPPLVASLARRVGRALRRAGVSYRLLDADGLVSAMAHSCDVDPLGPGEQLAQVREEWTEWHSARLAHRSFWVREWPPVDRVGAVLDQLSATPAALTSVTLVLVPAGHDHVDLRGLVRVAAPAPVLGRVCESVAATARPAGVDLFPLDGEHGPAVYATAPTGGGAV
jgi:type VII secretion protein EccE